MALTLNSNIASLRAANTLNETQGALSHTLSRISSGFRIVSAADDAAGSAVGTNLRTQARSGRQAIRNANDGLSIIQTAEAASREVVNILDRMRELSVQSASETLDNGERSYINDEFSDLSDEVQRIAIATEFNDVALTAAATTMEVQVGLDNSTASQVTISLGDLTSSTLGVTTTDVDLSSASGAQTAIGIIDTALDSVNDIRADYGSGGNRLTSSINNMTSYVESLNSAASQIMDADYAYETAEMTRLQVLQQAGISALAQARSMNQSVLALL